MLIYIHIQLIAIGFQLSHYTGSHVMATMKIDIGINAKDRKKIAGGLASQE